MGHSRQSRAAKKFVYDLFRILVGGYGQVFYPIDKKFKQTAIVRKIKHRHSIVEKKVEDRLVSFEGIRCVCGHEFLRQIRCEWRGNKTWEFRCARCGLVPLQKQSIKKLLEKKPLELESRGESALIWVGILPNPYKV